MNNVKILADSHVSPNFDSTGVIMISTALLCDAIIGNVQEKSMKNHNASNSEVVLYSYGIGFVYLLMFMLVSGGFLDGLYYFSFVSWFIHCFILSYYNLKYISY